MQLFNRFTIIRSSKVTQTELSNGPKYWLEKGLPKEAVKLAVYPANTDIVREHQRISDLTLLQRGWVAIHKSGLNGRRVTLDITRRRGYLLTPETVEGPDSRTEATITTLTPAEILSVKWNDLSTCAQADPKLMRGLLNTMVHQNRAALTRLAVISAMSVKDRIIEVLLKTAEIQTEFPEFLPLEEDLANLATASREYISLCISKARKAGVINFEERGGVVVLQPEMLKRTLLAH